MIRFKNPDLGQDTVFGRKDAKTIETTPGRVRFNEIWPAGLGFINKTISKKDLPTSSGGASRSPAMSKTVAALDRLKNLGFRSATLSGCSIGMHRHVHPDREG